MNTMTEQISEVSSVIKNLIEIQEDITVPRNVRLKIESINSTLRKETGLSIKINKALNELDELSSDVNLQAYTRTQIWNVMSALEKLC
ncbi:UPF0147 family protein [Candidatus Woesearchaeota archaeon]|nr:UPF0147 family protein [Candidatus Woesearchaeota archaeon]